MSSSPIEHLWFKSVLLLTAYIRNGTETFVLNFQHSTSATSHIRNPLGVIKF